MVCMSDIPIDHAHQTPSCTCHAWPHTAAAEQTGWTLLSRHRTSQGEVRYCRTHYGALVILLNGEVIHEVDPGTVRLTV